MWSLGHCDYGYYYWFTASYGDTTLYYDQGHLYLGCSSDPHPQRTLTPCHVTAFVTGVLLCQFICKTSFTDLVFCCQDIYRQSYIRVLSDIQLLVHVATKAGHIGYVHRKLMGNLKCLALCINRSCDHRRRIYAVAFAGKSKWLALIFAMIAGSPCENN